MQGSDAPLRRRRPLWRRRVSHHSSRLRSRLHRQSSRTHARRALSNETMSINDSPHLVTCSFGATSWRPGMEPSADALIRIADNALYMAKGQGRDRVVYLP